MHSVLSADCPAVWHRLFPLQNMTEILRRIDVTAYDFVGLSERFFRGERFCGYSDWVQAVFRNQPTLSAALGPLPALTDTNVSAS